MDICVQVRMYVTTVTQSQLANVIPYVQIIVTEKNLGTIVESELIKKI